MCTYVDYVKGLHIYPHMHTHTYERLMQSKYMQCLIMDFPGGCGMHSLTSYMG